MVQKVTKVEESVFYAVDLHVHTPASKCYTGSDTDEEYLSILQRYSDKGVRIIAITDHNSIKGYKRLLSIRNKLRAERAILVKYSGYPRIDESLSVIDEKLDIFSDVLILPGVELGVRPGVHMLFIFNPSSDLNHIEEFIVAAGYPEDLQGEEDPEGLPNFDVEQALRHYSPLDGIAIGAHIDSGNGIYNCLQGKYRATVFRMNELKGISYNSPATADKIRSLLRDPMYKRTEPLAFIQASDYHGGESIGNRISYFMLDEVCYDSLVAAFKNPSECISPTQHPEVVNIIQGIIDDPNTVIIDSLSEHDQERITFAACALLNQGRGSILIGVDSSRKSLLGVHGNEQEISVLVDSLLEHIQPAFDADIKFYLYGDDRYIVVIRLLPLLQSLYSIGDSCVYLMLDDDAKQATVNEIQNFVESKAHKRFDWYASNQQRQMKKIMREVKSQLSIARLLPLAYRIERQCYRLRDVVEFELVTPEKTKDVPDQFVNGEALGNAVCVGRGDPHLPETYLRCSSPQLMIDTTTSLQFNEDRILIVFGGATYLKVASGPWDIFQVGNKLSPVLVLRVKPGFQDKISDIALVLWLKSTVCLWLSYVNASTIDIYSPIAFLQLMVPDSSLFLPGGKLDAMGKEILCLETEFLMMPDPSEEDYQRHNTYIEQIGLDVDMLLCEQFGISVLDIQDMLVCLDDLNMYHPLSRVELPEEIDQTSAEAAFAADDVYE